MPLEINIHATAVLDGAVYAKIRVTKAMMTDAEPLVLSDWIFRLGEMNPQLKACLLIIHLGRVA